MPVALDPDNRFGISSPETDAFLATQTNFLVRRGFNPIDRNQYLDNEFWGEVVLRVQAGNLRVIDVQQRLKKPAAATTEATSS